jgi:ParB family chromosome partitioning protein
MLQMLTNNHFDGWEEEQSSAKIKNNEWYTPSYLIESAREVMDGIELDPASCEAANQIVKAERYYAQEQNGILQSWHARSLWLNPPYSKIDNRSGIEAFVNKLIQEYESGNVRQAILLATVRTEAAWYQPLWNYPICFPDHIIHFFKPSDKVLPEKDSRHGHFFGTSLTYLGPNELRFVETFSQFGRIVKAIDTPKEKVAPRSLWEVQG